MEELIDELNSSLETVNDELEKTDQLKHVDLLNPNDFISEREVRLLKQDLESLRQDYPSISGIDTAIDKITEIQNTIWESE